MRKQITGTAIVAEIQRIAARNPTGTALPKDIVDAARPKRSVLHHLFDWEDTRAAELWRLHQARNILRVTVTYLDSGEGEQLAIRAFVSLTPDRHTGLGYRAMLTVMSDPESRGQLLADALAELTVFRRKYAHLSELAEVFAAADKVRRKAGHVRRSRAKPISA